MTPSLIRFLLPIFLLTTSCSSTPKNEAQQTVKIAMMNEPATLNPHRARAQHEFAILHMLYEGLFRINSENRPALGLVKSYSASKNGTVYTFKLKKSHWSDGSLVTAQQFIDSWKAALSPKFPAVYAEELFVIKNAAKICHGQMSPDKLGAYSTDPYTLVMELEKPVPYLLALLSQTVFLPIHPDWEKGVSNGTFQLDEWLISDRMRLQKNPHYRNRHQVRIDAIDMLVISNETAVHMFERNELDWVGMPFSNISVEMIADLQKKNLLRRRSSLSTAWIEINIEKPPFNHPLVRKAFAEAIDRQELVDHIFIGASQPMTSILPASLLEVKHPELDAPSMPDLGVANVIKRGPKISLTYRSIPDWHKAAQALQQQWKTAFGIDVELEGLESQAFFARCAAKDFQMCIGSWVADYADPISILNVFKTKDLGPNETNWESPEYYRLIEESQTIMNPKQRKSILRAAENILNEAMPVIPLYERSFIYVKSDRLKNLSASATQMLDFENAYLD